MTNSHHINPAADSPILWGSSPEKDLIGRCLDGIPQAWSIKVDEDAEEISLDLLARLLAQGAKGAAANGQSNGRHGCCADAPATNGNGKVAAEAPHNGRAAPRRSSCVRLPR